MSKAKQKKQQEDQFTFKLLEISVNNFRISIPKDEYNIDAIALEFGANFDIHPEKDLTTCNVHFRFLYPNEKDVAKPIVIMHIDIAYDFSVLELKRFSQEFDGKLGLDSYVHITLLSIAFSTSRGIVYERTRGYFPAKMLLPVINPRDLNLEILGKKGN